MRGGTSHDGVSGGGADNAAAHRPRRRSAENVNPDPDNKTHDNKNLLQKLMSWCNRVSAPLVRPPSCLCVFWRTMGSGTLGILSHRHLHHQHLHLDHQQPHLHHQHLHLHHLLGLLSHQGLHSAPKGPCRRASA